MNRRAFLQLGAVPLVAGLAAPSFAATPTDEIPLLEGEQWWAGVVADAHRMPLSTAPYAFDFDGDTAGNQGQPLLLSSKGRYIWSEHPFRFSFEEGFIRLSSRFAPPIMGRHGASLPEAYRYASATFFPPSGRLPDPLLFTRPQFNTWIELTYNQNQADVLDYARAVVRHGFSPGVLMIDEGWFSVYGNLEFDRSRFPDPLAMMRELHDLGFRVMLWICPYITPDGPFYKSLYLDGVGGRRTVWIRNRDNPSSPVLTSWWDGYSAVVDLTAPDGLAWFRGQLDRLQTTYGVDGFKFDGGDASHYTQPQLLAPPLAFDERAHANAHSEAYARLGLDYPMNEYRACWKMGGQALAQRLRDKTHSWDDLRMLVPGITNQGLMGYPFTCPDLIGGGEYLSFLNLETIDQELIVRAAQCHALMPMMQFSVAPWRVLDEQHLARCREMAALHTRMGDEILTLAQAAAQTGEPIVRHLEYAFPHQGFVDVSDQFMLGEAILVAPVLEKGARRRTIRFPEGRWQGDDGSVVRGPRVVEVEAPLNRLPWYRRLR